MSALHVVNGTVCGAQENNQFFSDTNSTILTSGQSIGLALTVEASLLSFGAVFVIFFLTARNLLRYRKTLPNGDRKLLRTPTDIYMLSLFSYDIVQAVGGILSVRWAHNGIVTTGPYCTAQGIIKQTGALGVALLSLEPKRVTLLSGSVAFTCLFVGLSAGISNGIHKDFETPTPYWCWISPKYHEARLVSEYVWMWIALFASVVMYIPLHFWMKGHLSVDDEKWYKFRLVKSDVEYSKRRATLGILLYPLAYTLVVIPLSVARWLLFSHKSVPSATTFFGLTMFNLSGAVNVLLFMIVRPRLLLFTPLEELSESSEELANTCTSSHDQSLQPI
ncbi:hypothetical protein EDB89DRAFT_2071969 [Lactarius sanguifluus]|nr:hypothetical protein EDB89DRAFT_2071969 [Lactarius sanguifluus]